MTSYSVFIVDASSRQPVEAELLDTIGERQLLDWQFQWRRILETYLRRLADNGVTRQGLDWPQSWHWDWRAKVDEVRGLLGHTGYSVICRDVTQGMMRLDLASRLARLDGQVGKPLVYIDYRLCCANPVRDSSRESSMVAGVHEQTHISDLQDHELASL